MCIEYHIYINMYHVNAQGVDERMTMYIIIITIIIIIIIKENAAVVDDFQLLALC